MITHAQPIHDNPSTERQKFGESTRHHDIVWVLKFSASISRATTRNVHRGFTLFSSWIYILAYMTFGIYSARGWRFHMHHCALSLVLYIHHLITLSYFLRAFINLSSLRFSSSLAHTIIRQLFYVYLCVYRFCNVYFL